MQPARFRVAHVLVFREIDRKLHLNLDSELTGPYSSSFTFMTDGVVFSLINLEEDMRARGGGVPTV